MSHKDNLVTCDSHVTKLSFLIGAWLQTRGDQILHYTFYNDIRKKVDVQIVIFCQKWGFKSLFLILSEFEYRFRFFKNNYLRVTSANLDPFYAPNLDIHMRIYTMYACIISSQDEIDFDSNDNVLMALVARVVSKAACQKRKHCRYF